MAARPIAVDSPAPGVCVYVYDETPPVRVRVRTATEMADWVLFVTDPTRDESALVATTIEYRGVLYAIARREHTPSGWQYDLIPWPSGELPRRKFTLSREFFQAIEEEKKTEVQERRRSKLFSALGFLIAFLPSSIQGYISEEYDYDAVGWTKINSAVIGLLSLGLTVIYDVIVPLAAAYPAAYAGATISWPGRLLWPYLALDSLARFGNAVAGEKPLGLLPVEIVYWVGCKIRRRASQREAKATGGRDETVNNNRVDRKGAIGSNEIHHQT